MRSRRRIVRARTPSKQAVARIDLPRPELSGILTAAARGPAALVDTGELLKTTVSAELGGSRFDLDEDALAALRAYLDRAGERLGSHPDRTAVLAGLERSIAAQLQRARAAAGEPVDAATMSAALAAVGRVDGPKLDGEHGDPLVHRAPRKLYRLQEGRKIAGVCAGLAAFAEIDVSLVRLGFILGAFFTGGMLIAAYIVLVLVMPVARTPEEIAAAHGGRAVG
jgi:phage shock protein PspC (stress-responsive transcriptional regulator)